MLAGPGIATAGHAYAWVDVLSSNAPSRPVLAGRYGPERQAHDERAGHTGDLSRASARKGQAALLSQLSRGQSEKDKIASRLWALQARLGKNQTSASALSHQP